MRAGRRMSGEVCVRALPSKYSSTHPPDCILTCLAGTTQFTDTRWIVLRIKFVSPPWSPREMKECKNSPSGWCHPLPFPQTPLNPTGLVSSTSAQLSLLPALGSHQYPNTHPKSTQPPHTHAPLQLGWMWGSRRTTTCYTSLEPEHMALKNFTTEWSFTQVIITKITQV